MIKQVWRENLQDKDIAPADFIYGNLILCKGSLNPMKTDVECAYWRSNYPHHSVVWFYQTAKIRKAKYERHNGAWRKVND